MAANIGQHPESLAMIDGRLTLTEPDGRVIVLEGVTIKQWSLSMDQPTLGYADSTAPGIKQFVPSPPVVSLTCEFVAGSLEVADGASAVEQKAAVKKAVDNAARHVLNPSRKFRKE